MPPSRAPTARSRLVTMRSSSTRLASSSTGAAAAASRAPSSPPGCSCCCAAPCAAGPEPARCRSVDGSTAASRASRGSRRRRHSTRPTASPKVRRPSTARWRRTSSARCSRYASTCAGVAANLERSSGRCVAIPTGQVSRWHERTIRQPSASSSAVPNETSSAPRSAAATTSLPVFSPPSTRRRTRLRNPSETSVRCVSARPSSHGAPAFLIEESGLAPVPPSQPAT